MSSSTDPATKTYSINPKTIASRNRAKEWSEDEVKLYKKQVADRTFISKRLKLLRET